MKVKFNVKGVESGGNRPLVKPGVYPVKITECSLEQPEGKDPRLEIVAKIQKKGNEFDGQTLRKDYINVVAESQAWKLRQFLEAVGLVTDKKEAGEFDPAKLVNKVVRARVKSHMDDEWGAQNEVGTWLEVDDDEDTGEEDLSEETEAEEETEADEESEAEESEDESGEESDDEEDDELWTEEELSELDDDDLKLYAFGGEDEDGDEIEGLLDDGDESDYVTKKKKGKKTVSVLDREKLIAAMIEAQGGDEDGEEEETPDYESMDEDALRAMCKERGLSTKGKKTVLVKRLQKDDEPF